MITRSDDSNVYDALAMAELLYFFNYPLEIFCEILWDGHHWKNVIALAKQKQRVDLKHCMDWMGETYLREEMELIIQCASPRLCREIWGENGDSGEEQDLDENLV